MPLPPDLPIDDIRATARRDAARVLREHWLCRTTPVDPGAIARSLGARVRTAVLGDDAWGLLVGKADGVDLFVDAHRSQLRSRFACAHEVGHLVERGALSAHEALTDLRSAQHRTRAEEAYANEFAVALLLPTDAFLAARTDGDDDFAIARRFLVPPAAARWRAMHLRREDRAARPAA